MNINQIEEARALAPIVYHNITAVDKGPWMVVQYVPNLGTGGSAATVQIAAGSATMLFKVDAATPLTLDIVGGTSGQISLVGSDSDTMGEVVDLINSVSAWRAYLLGAIRADLPSHLIAAGAASCIGANGLTLYSDSSANLGEISYAISGEKFVTNGIGGHCKDEDDQVLNQLLHADIKVTGASPQVIQYYSGKQGSTETKIAANILLTTATNKQQGETHPNEPYIVANRGERLLIRVQALSPDTPPTSPTLNYAGKSIVYKNDRIVDTVAFPA